MSGDRPEPKLQPMPMERAILWNPSLPGARTSGRAPYPIFFQQEAVMALQEHLKSSPQQAIFGFLIGDVYRDPDTGVLYTLIDKTLRLNQAIYGDKTEVVVSRLWDRMQEQLAKAAGVLLGWYHSHPGQGGFLTAHDVETHEKFFSDPWQVAVLVAAEAGGVTGRFFRSSQNADWHKTPLPFYELLQPDSIKADGKKRSFITWRNYKAFASKTEAKKDVKKGAEKKGVEQENVAKDDVAEAVKEDGSEDAPEQDQLRIMRGSADDIPVIRTSADDEPAPAPVPTPPPPPPPPASKKRPSAPVFIPDEPEPEAEPEPAPPPPAAPRSRRPSGATGPAADLPWQVPPEELPPPPPLPPPAPRAPAPAPPAAREPRRTPTHQFRLLDQEAEAPRPRRRKKKRRWLGKVALLLLLAGAGAGAYWYFALRDPTKPPPWAGLVDRAKRLVARSASPPPPPPAGPARRPTSRPAGGSPRAAPPPAPPVRPPVDATFARFDRLSDSLSQAVRGFQERAALFASGQLDCAALARGLVAVERLWITYNNERRARISAFDPRRASQDQALYARVDSVESRFEGTGCSRP